MEQAAVTSYYEAMQEVMDEDDLEETMEVHTAFSECTNVGAGLSGGFGNTRDFV